MGFRTTVKRTMYFVGVRWYKFYTALLLWITSLHWEDGRQNSGYKKFKLWSFLSSDGWIIWYPKGSSVPVHRDGTFKGKRHRRLNIVLYNSSDSCFKHNAQAPYLVTEWFFNRIVLFYASEVDHWVDEVDGTRVVLSFGWLENAK